MPLAIQPITPAIAALAADLGIALQPGTVVNAQVMKVLDANLVRIAIGSLMLDATTINPLQQGQRLQLAVGQTQNALTLTPVAADAAPVSTNTTALADDIPLAPKLPSGAPAVPALTPRETRAVVVAAQSAVPKQVGLSQLFANLSAAVEAKALPSAVVDAATQVLDLRQSATEISGDDIKTALAASGLMFEAAAAQPSSPPPPDLKSALLVLRQALSTWLTDTDGTPAAAARATVTAASIEEAPLPSAPTSAEPVRTATTEPVADAVQALFVQTKGGMTAAGSKDLLAMQLIASEARPATQPQTPLPRAAQTPLPPPFRDGLPSPQQVATASLGPDRQPEAVARQLISDTDGALARQTLLQVASLPDRIDQQALRSDPAQPRWNFEIPFVTPQGTAMAQLEIARDSGGQDVEAAQRHWRARFSLNLEPAGPVHALVVFGGDATNVKMWAERPATAAQLRANIGQLNVSLEKADLKAGDIVVADGAPMQARAPSAGHFLNRAT